MSQIDDLIADSEDGLPAFDSPAYEAARLEDPKTRDAAVERIGSRPDHSSFLLLLALRRDAREAYDALPASTRAAVLCAGLRGNVALNDFGVLDTDGSRDGHAARALIETGGVTVPLLAALLDDRSPAGLDGSEESTIARTLRLRRADFAYRYLSLILGREPEFDADPSARDVHIAELRAALRSR